LLAPDGPLDAATVQLALPHTAPGSAAAATASGALAERVEIFERETILVELKRQNHHMTNTAKALGLERSHLYKKCQQLGIDLHSIRKSE